MKNIYKIIGLLIIVTLLIVGCSAEDPKPNLGEVEQDQLEEDIGESEELVEEEENKEDIKEEQEEDKEDVEEQVDEEEVESFDGKIKSQALIDLMNNKNYTMKMKIMSNVAGREFEVLTTTAVADNQTYSITESEGSILEFIEKEDKSYMIMHDSKTIIVSDRYEEEDKLDPSDGNIVYDDLEYVGKGTETFLGNKRPYQEYKTEFGRVKYYFDKKEIDGMEMIINMKEILEDEDEEEIDDETLGMDYVKMIIDIISIEKDVDMSLFELPKDYQIVGN